MAEPISEAGHGSDEPQQDAGEVDPDCVLHPLDVGITLGILRDEHLRELALVYPIYRTDVTTIAAGGDGGGGRVEG